MHARDGKPIDIPVVTQTWLATLLHFRLGFIGKDTAV
jgi:hypothetical protein